MPVAQSQQPTLAERILALKERAANVGRLRAQAEAAISMSKTQVEQIGAELKKLGVDPENCEQELAALEAQLAASVADLETRVAQEEQECQTILTAARQAQLIQ